MTHMTDRPIPVAYQSEPAARSRLLASRLSVGLVHFVVRLAVPVIYRARILNAQHIPRKGGGLLVCNHVSYLDAFVISALSPRPVRFVMSHRIYRKPAGNWFFRLAGAIPVASGPGDGSLLQDAYDQCAQALSRGELICIFPEGKRSPDGDVSRFQPGVRYILRRAPVPVIPLALKGLWGSVFSRDARARLPRMLRSRARSLITMAVGEPVEPTQAAPARLRQVVETLHQSIR